MPIETFDFITQLVPTDPVDTDGITQGAAHLRGIKQTLQNTFPNMSGAFTGSQTDLNAIIGLVSSGVLTVPPVSGTVGAGLVLKGASTGPQTDLLLRNDNGSLGIYTGTAPSTWTNVASLDASGDMTLTGWLTAAILKQAGNALLPSGCIIQWSGSTTAIPAGWHLCDGTSGTPDLRDRFIVGAGYSYAPGAVGGTATPTLTTSTAGAHAHGGADQPAGGFSYTWVTDAQGLHAHGYATGGHALTTNELPAHDHGLDGLNLVADTYPASNVGKTNTGGGTGFSYYQAQSTGQNWAHTHPISADGLHQHNVPITVGNHSHAITTDGSHSHTVSGNTLPPYYALAFIYKL